MSSFKKEKPQKLCLLATATATAATFLLSLSSFSLGLGILLLVPRCVAFLLAYFVFFLNGCAVMDTIWVLYPVLVGLLVSFFFIFLQMIMIICCKETMEQDIKVIIKNK
jgi:hypothetical protein